MRYYDLLIRGVRDVGFPIAVAAYLLYRLSPQVDTLKDSVVDLKNTVGSMVAVLKDDHDDLRRLIDGGGRAR